MAGRHPSSSFKMDKQIVPEGYTFGWNNGGTNLPKKKSNMFNDGQTAAFIQGYIHFGTCSDHNVLGHEPSKSRRKEM